MAFDGGTAFICLAQLMFLKLENVLFDVFQQKFLLINSHTKNQEEDSLE